MKEVRTTITITVYEDNSIHTQEHPRDNNAALKLNSLEWLGVLSGATIGTTAFVRDDDVAKVKN